MTPREFIEKNITQMLQKDGYSGVALAEGVKASLRLYDNQPVFRPGKCFDDCLSAAKHEDKSYKRLMEQQQKKADAEAKAAASKRPLQRGVNERVRQQPRRSAATTSQ